jgi:sulfate permease, SulP family
VSVVVEGTPAASWTQTYTPKSIICLREGYNPRSLLRDLVAGLTVGVIALPLAMAFAIGSGPGTSPDTTIRPEQGLYTAIIAGFIIALLGGSRVSVAGPTGAFVPILFAIVAKHGYEGLAIATFMAGVILIIMGAIRLGGMIKFIPYPVTTGFTTGIAVIIFSGTIKDFFGLHTAGAVPAEFVAKWAYYVEAFREHGVNAYTTALAVGAVLFISLMRKFAPRVPGAIIAVIVAAAVVAIFHLDGKLGVDTIETHFKGGIPQKPPLPHFPVLSWDHIGIMLGKARQLIPDATTIALLGAIESLLCCVVADGMIGSRHKSNGELVALGIGNILSVFFGGIPATGAIARTAANIKAGGRTPVASMVHAVFVLIVMLALAPYAGKIPLSVLAAILVVVAWNMAEIDHFRSLLKAPKSDIAVLLTTFGLTVLVDLTTAVGVGMVIAALLFMKRMTDVTSMNAIKQEVDENWAETNDPNSISGRDVPAGVEVYEINGPFFFGVADMLKDTLRGVERPPKVFILRMRRVPAIDASGMHALDEFYEKCHRQGTRLLLAGVHAQPMFALMQYGLVDKIGEANLFESIDDALDEAHRVLGLPIAAKPAQAIAEVARAKP